MSAKALLEELRERGVELVPDGDRLRYRPKQATTTDLLDRLKAHKQQLLKLLEWERRKLEETDRRGLVIRWSEYPIWIKLHDPLTGVWHEVRASECLPGVVRTADKYRKKGSLA
jgi:hypothetical protein